MVENKEKTKMLFMGYETNSIGGHREDRSDPYSLRSDCYLNPKVIGFSDKREADFYHYENIETSSELDFFETIYAVVVTYRDGDTFGRTYGNLCLDSAFNDKEMAQKRLEEIYNGKSDTIYEPWNGYFSGLEEVNIYSVNMKTHCNCPRTHKYEIIS